jgi:cob(I)alamin adenosyltransferase
MGFRLSRIYTRTGDQGMTGLGEGTRVPKDSGRVECYGTVDELNSVIGLLLATGVPDALEEPLLAIQHRLFDLGGELSIPGNSAISDDHVTELEQWLDDLNAGLSPLEEFILPGGTQAAAVCHLARTVCRRAERRLVTLTHQDSVNPASVKYLNRLSDLLFVMARAINKEAGQPDILWQHDRK